MFRVTAKLRLLAVTAVLALLVASSSIAQAANNSEQVIFSGTGFGTFANTATPVGFWIWCEAESHNPYAGECNGSMYFYALRIVKHVVDGSISEPSEGMYQISVVSSDGSISCTLTNVPPITKGPTNTVNVSCATPSGSGQSTSAVVNATGP